MTVYNQPGQLQPTHEYWYPATSPASQPPVYQVLIKHLTVNNHPAPSAGHNRVLATMRLGS